MNYFKIWNLEHRINILEYFISKNIPIGCKGTVEKELLIVKKELSNLIKF